MWKKVYLEREGRCCLVVKSVAEWREVSSKCMCVRVELAREI